MDCLDREDAKNEVRKKYNDLLQTKRDNKNSDFSLNIFDRFFRETFGLDWRKSLPHSHHWICQIVPDSISTLEERIPIMKKEAFVDLNELANVFKEMGGYGGLVNLYCMGVNIPGEDIAYEQAGCSTGGNHGFLQPMVLGNRNHSHLLNLQFREHNVSFTESFIRPWILLSGYTGAIDLTNNFSGNDVDGVPSIKAEIRIYRLACNVKDGGDGVTIRDEYVFRGCLPVSIGSETLTYDPGQTVTKETTFIYNKMSYRSYGNFESNSGTIFFEQ